MSHARASNFGGLIADGNIHDLAEACRDGDISKEDFCQAIVNKDWANKLQIAIKTAKGLAGLHREEEKE